MKCAAIGNRPKVLLVVVAGILAAGLLTLVGTKPAEAAFPRENGKIAFVSNRDGAASESDSEIYVMNADGSNQTRLTDTGGLAHNGAPAFSADGEKIAFESNRNSSSYEIYIMDARDEDGDGNGDNLIRLTDTGGVVHNEQPAFSPNGSKIAFVSNRDESNGEIYIMNSDGSNLIRLTDTVGSFDRSPTFSPDGDRIAFWSNRSSGNDDIYMMNAQDTNGDGNGDDLTRLTTASAVDRDPAFSPDGTKIAFSRWPLSGDTEIYVMNAAPANTTTNIPQPLTNNSSEEGGPDWQPCINSICSVVPPDGATRVLRTTNVTATFAKEMDSTTLTTSTFTLTKQGSATPVEAAVSYNEATKTATLDPSTDLEPDTTYTATVKGGPDGAKDATGTALVADKVWSYSTVEVVPPEVTEVSPLESATRVSRLSNVTATFSEPMNKYTLVTVPLHQTSTTVTLVKNGSTTPVPARVSYDATTKKVTLDPFPDNPTQKLARRTTYKAKISGATDLAGNTLPDKVWYFKTQRK